MNIHRYDFYFYVHEDIHVYKNSKVTGPPIVQKTLFTYITSNSEYDTMTILVQMHGTMESLYVKFYSNNKMYKPLPSNNSNYVKALTNIRFLLCPFHFHFAVFNHTGPKHSDTSEVETKMYF